MTRRHWYAPALAALAVVLATPAGAPAAFADQQVPTASAPVVVPWRHIAPRAEPTIPLPARVHRVCADGSLVVASVSSGIWHASIVTISLRAKGPACLVPGVASVVGNRPDGSRLRLRVNRVDLSVNPPLRPAAGRDGEVNLWLTMPYCTRPDGSTTPPDRRRDVTHVSLTFASGQVIGLPGQLLNDSCGLTVSLNRPVGDLDTTTVPSIRPLPGWGNVRASGPLPSTLVRGTTARFTVTVRNASRTPFSLASCPNWTITFLPFATKGRAVYTARGRLNCAAAPHTIPPFGSVTFAMRYRVPLHVPTGVAGFSWVLDQTAAWAHSDNPTTGDALVS